MPETTTIAALDIGRRLRELREVESIPVDELARVCGVAPEAYREAEAGRADLPASALNALAARFGVDLGLLLTGETPRMAHAAITRAGRAPRVARRADYGYESLAANFKNARFEPFAVTIPVAGDDAKVPTNVHDGQEFNYILQGRVLLRLRGNDHILGPGDSILFDAREPHGMKALDRAPARFLAVITL